ncbi:MAG: pilus assembly protein N-terminal domain-containing protein [Pseudomonadota bacterium]
MIVMRASYRHFRKSAKRGLAALAVGVTLISSAAGPISQAHANNDLIVRYDQSQLLRLPRPVSEVIIGNASIADVSVQAGNLLVVTGKTFGVTNIIALDLQKNVIQDQRVIVQRDEARVVNLHKGSKRFSFTCAPNCTPTITIGDENQYFETISKHASTKKGFSESNSAPSDPLSQ